MGKPMPCIICELRETGCSAKDARIKALESDAEVDAQLIRDKDAEIERLKAQQAVAVAFIKTAPGRLPQEIQDIVYPAVALAATRQPPHGECLIAGMTCPCPCHSRQPLREMPEACGCTYCTCDDLEIGTVFCGMWIKTRKHCRSKHYSPRGGEGEGE